MNFTVKAESTCPHLKCVVSGSYLSQRFKGAEVMSIYLSTAYSLGNMVTMLMINGISY